MASIKLKILYVALRYDYGIEERGYSYEHINFYDTLTNLPDIELVYFPFDVHLRNLGRSGMNDLLLKSIAEHEPTLCFFVLFTDEIKIDTLDRIKAGGTCQTLNWFCDDHWRFDGFSKYYAPHLDWVLTTDRYAVDKYKALGITNVIPTQWGYNHFRYSPQISTEKYGVSFVGKAHSSRKKTISRLNDAGITVTCWGQNWESGRISFQKMMEVYTNSEINLNFTESSMSPGLIPFLKVFLTRRANSTYRINSFRELKAHLNVLRSGARPQIKGRNFEIPGTGGFLMTEYAEGLEEYFIPEKEISVFYDGDDLIDKVRYYSSHASERESVRQAGHSRAQRDHTFAQRFSDIFKTIGLI